jgi:hypothetical protein
MTMSCHCYFSRISLQEEAMIIPIILGTNVSSKLRACGCCTQAHFYWFSIQSIWINKNNKEKPSYKFLLFLRAYKFNVCYGPRLPKPTQLLLRRHHGLHTCIPSLEGMLLGTVHCLGYIRYASHYVSMLSSHLQVLAVIILTNGTFSIA